MGLLTEVLAGREAREFASVDEFWAWHVEDARELPRPVDRALAGGASADRLGYAFAAGYAAAVQALVPGIQPGTLASLAATEEGGAHPKAIKTELSRREGNWRLSGRKQLVTLAGSELLVLARQGEKPDGRADLVLVRVGRSRPGVRVDPLPTLPFAPEIPHAQIAFEDVPVDPADVLPGDGWERWVKPFRTVEDVHVHAALLGHLLSLGARYGWERALRERLAATLVTLRALATADPSSAGVHVALAGAIAASKQALRELEPAWASAPAAVRERWERDRPLLQVAEKARAAREERAWQRIAEHRHGF